MRFIATRRPFTTRPSGTGTIKPVYINSNGQLGTQAPASARRFKDRIKPMDKSSEGILALNPVALHYKNGDQGTPQFGLIAEEVARINPDLVVHDDNGEMYTVRYDAVNAMLLNEFIKEHQRVRERQGRLERQEALIANSKSRLKRLLRSCRKLAISWNRVDQRQETN